MTIKSVFKSKSFYLFVGTLAVGVLLMAVSVNMLISELDRVKERYCDVTPDSTLCQMYPNIDESQ